MQIVIDIPYEVYAEKNNPSFTNKATLEILRSVRNGIPLPKGHGRLISENDAIKAIELRDKELRKDTQYIKKRGYIDVLGIKKFIYAVPTIIEADKGED